MLKKLFLISISLSLLFPFLFPNQAEAKVLGAVATQHPLATQTAARILKEGGNAMDAAVAAAFTLAVVEPYNSGLGAGGMTLIWDGPKKKAFAIDFREQAPRAATSSMYQKPGIPEDASRDGPLAIAVPGEVAGLEEIHRRWGSLPWSRLLKDAIAYAEKGWEVGEPLKQRIEKRRDCLLRDYHSSQVYRDFLRTSDGESGENPTLFWKQANLARTLERIRDFGAKDFYRGRIAQQIIQSLGSKGALLSGQDLRNYSVNQLAPVTSRFPWGKVWGMPPPSSGGISVIRGLNILEVLKEKSPQDFGNQWIPWLVRTLEPIFQARNTAMGDPKFVKGMPIRRWLSKPQARRDAKNILTENPHFPSPNPENQASTGQTTHLSVLDSLGNGVAMTLTLNLSFGSCVTAGETGILMNDQMDDFAAHPGKPNAFGLVQGKNDFIQPGKRPLSSMSPTLVTDQKKLILAIGSPGGPRIITSVLQVLTRVFMFKEPLPQAMAEPRIHFQDIPRKIFVEFNLDEKTQKALEKLGIPLDPSAPWSNVQAVTYDPEGHTYQAFSDPRGTGRAQIVTTPGH